MKKLSEGYIEKHSEEIDWYWVSEYQKLSERIIEKYKDKVDWCWVSSCQKLSEEFIEKYSDKVDWNYISRCQILSEGFIEKHKDKIENVEIQLKTHHNHLTIEEKKDQLIKYAKKYELKFDGEYLYAFREHDFNNSGIYNKTIYYDEKKIYEDWRCNLNSEDVNSFGLGIFPEGNIEVRIKIDWLGCWVENSDKLRVWKFEII